MLGKLWYSSFECVVNQNGEKVNLVQHVWNVTNDHKCLMYGLCSGASYR